MNSKARVLAAINHRQPDRVPVDLWTVPLTTDSVRAYLGVDDEQGILQALGVDLRPVWPAYAGPDLRRFEDGTWIDCWGCRRRMVGPFEAVIDAPLADARSPTDVESHVWPDPDWFDVRGMLERCQEWKDYALVIRDPGQNDACVLSVALHLRGADKFLLDMALNPDLARAIIARVEAFYLGLNQRILETAGPLTDILFIADDLGDQHRLMISPRMFRKFIKPSLTRYCEQAHRYGQKVMYHTCGSVRPLIPDFIDMGVDILNPIQTSADGMDPEELKQSYGDALCFHGGLDIQTVLTEGTPDQVRTEVARLVQALGVGGGFILAPTNHLMPDTPGENVVAMYDAARTSG